MADCVNIQALWLSGITPYPGITVHATNQIKKTSVGGSLESVPWRVFNTTRLALDAAEEEGLAVVAYEQVKESTPWPLAHPPFPLLAVFGHERDGVEEIVLERARAIVELPVRGITNSLNVALAASAVLYRLLQASQG